ncbi:hypothetical protein [Anaerococcus sp. Marseille-P3915]|uniref:hypothetical protein n=1 Tax=Anaerococcus sp. Marseille-P3915 TaxID=2057799 RepID=UPI000D0B8475|nr:hypothetical protein [Anaerococcus sp. Marseille-P3915]
MRKGPWPSPFGEVISLMKIIHYEIKLRRKNYIIILPWIIKIILLSWIKKGIFRGKPPKKTFYKGKGRAPGSPSNNLIENKF